MLSFRDAWKTKLRCGCGMAEIVGDQCTPTECLLEAVRAYEKPDGYLVLSRQSASGTVIQCFSKEPGKATPSIPAELASRSTASGEVWDHVRALLEWIHFRRHRRTFKDDLARVDAGDLDAEVRVEKTRAEYRGLRSGGTLESVRGNDDHLAILMIGETFGLFDLSGRELADCFNAICSCGIRFHDCDSLERLRRWLAGFISGK